MATRQWTPEQRKEQGEKIRQWQPWRNSTGAKTVEGKSRSSMNAYKGGYRQKMKELRHLLKELAILVS